MMIQLLIGLALVFGLLALIGRRGYRAIRATGEWAGVSVSTSVDSPAARYFLEDYQGDGTSGRARSKLDDQIGALLQRWSHALPTRDELAAVAACVPCARPAGARVPLGRQAPGAEERAGARGGAG